MSVVMYSQGVSEKSRSWALAQHRATVKVMMMMNRFNFQVSGFGLGREAKFCVSTYVSYVSRLKFATNGSHHTVDFGSIVARSAVCIVQPVGVFAHAQDVREVTEHDFSSET